MQLGRIVDWWVALLIIWPFIFLASGFGQREAFLWNLSGLLFNQIPVFKKLFVNQPPLSRLLFYASLCSILNSANYEMTIWSSIWLSLIASPLVCHYTVIISHSFLRVYMCVLSQLMEETNKNITWTRSTILSQSHSLLSVCQFITYYLSFYACLFISFSLSDAFLWRRSRSLAKASLSSITSPSMPKTSRDKIKCAICKLPLVWGLASLCKPLCIHLPCFIPTSAVGHLLIWLCIKTGRRWTNIELWFYLTWPAS